MTLIAENKAATKSSSARRSRASASIAKLDSSSSKTHVSKNEAIKTSSKELFEGRLGLMSSLRKGLTR